jgi:hypothetical protein
VRHAGRIVVRRSYREGSLGQRTLTFAPSCASPGSYDYSVGIRDPYGTSVTRTGSWDITARCNELRAAEQRKADARRRADERKRRQEQQQAPPTTRGGGGGGTPDYSGMNCSEIGHSFHVVPGTDPEHDRDNDGLACEDYPPG